MDEVLGRTIPILIPDTLFRELPGSAGKEACVEPLVGRSVGLEDGKY